MRRHREQSQQINRAYYARGRISTGVPPTITEGQNEMNFTEENDENIGGVVHGMNGQNRSNQHHVAAQPLQRRFHSEDDIRTGGQTSFRDNHTIIDMDFDDSTVDHVNALTAHFGSTLTIADP